jgi:hypothetical protein
MSTIIEQLKAYLDSDEGKADIKRHQELSTFRANLMGNRMDYLHNLSIDERDILFSKIKAKYDSDEYYHRWIDRGIEPPEDLYYYILQYGYIYGKVNDIEDAYFGYDSYIIDNSWVITAWYGQGTAYNFDKINK